MVAVPSWTGSSQEHVEGLLGWSGKYRGGQERQESEDETHFWKVAAVGDRVIES